MSLAQYFFLLCAVGDFDDVPDIFLRLIQLVGFDIFRYSTEEMTHIVAEQRDGLLTVLNRLHLFFSPALLHLHHLVMLLNLQLLLILLEIDRTEEHIAQAQQKWCKFYHQHIVAVQKIRIYRRQVVEHVVETRYDGKGQKTAGGFFVQVDKGARRVFTDKRKGRD
ncbi:MAG: hypothetical protein IKI99_05060 [Firmicutes bacterium]|nr:hypothetical protein [Bacillota bacterium]